MAELARLTTPSSPKIISPIGDESNVAWKRLTLRSSSIRDCASSVMSTTWTIEH